jgi:uncharacterized protein YbbC (DUF1343 family)
VKSGLDRLRDGDGPDLRGRPVALLTHPAAHDSDFNPCADIVARIGANVVSFLGPEHGISAAAQDMEEVVSGGSSATPVYSLYGDTFESLSPTLAMFHGAQWLICDLQDVGARYYTYVWTVVMACEVALAAGCHVLILDRPNPIGGLDAWVEGGSIAPGYESFVGLHPVAVRHGMTLGELATMALSERGRVSLEKLEVLSCAGWRRSMMFDETGLPWILPSPNMPTLDTALVYPGQCLFEGTLLSEGRGTTRPFEIFGAPWVDSEALCRTLDRRHFTGLALRRVGFKPTFQKWGGQLCYGLQLHVTVPKEVRSLRSTWALLAALYQQSKEAFAWRTEPYEFVADKPAIDLLAGGSWLRQGIESGVCVDELERSQESERERFLARRRRFLVYPE